MPRRTWCSRCATENTSHCPSPDNNKPCPQVVQAYNSDPKVHGILVQLPLPSQINERRILDAISIEKDVDGFHPTNIGSLAMRGREPRFVPCTPMVCSFVCLSPSLGNWGGFNGFLHNIGMYRAAGEIQDPHFGQKGRRRWPIQHCGPAGRSAAAEQRCNCHNGPLAYS